MTYPAFAGRHNLQIVTIMHLVFLRSGLPCQRLKLRHYELRHRRVTASGKRDQTHYGMQGRQAM